MSFSGNLKTVSFGDNLQLISTGQKTGALLMIRGQQQKRIYFRTGQVIHACSESSEEDRLGQLLVRHGKIAPDQLEKALKKQKATNRRLGEIIVEMNLVDPHDIGEALRLQVEEIIYSLFAWGDGEFQFIEGEKPPEKAPLTEINTMTVMMEGARRFDEWSKIRDALPSADTIMKICPVPTVGGGEISLSGDEVEMFVLIDGRRRVDEIMKQYLRGEYVASRSLYKLIAAGLIEPVPNSANEDERDDEKSLFDFIFKLYSHSLSRIQHELTDYLGESGGRLFARPGSRRFERGMFEALTAGETGTARDKFMKAAESIPESVRLHKVLSQSAMLLQDRLGLIRDCLGERTAIKMTEIIKKDVAFLLAQKRRLADKYDVGREFMESMGIK